MRYPTGQKEQTRQRILDAAAVVFRRLGYRAGSVDKVMAEAGLTAGGFYAHFPSKEALFAETLAHAMRQTRTLQGPAADQPGGPDWARSAIETYLCMSHRRRTEDGCPLPALLAEVGRADESARVAFEGVLGDVAGKLAAHLPPGRGADDRALALIGLLVGGMTLARAVADDALAERILAACRTFADVGLGLPAAPTNPTPRKQTRRGGTSSPRRKDQGGSPS